MTNNSLTKIRQWTLNNDKQNHPKISFVEKYEPNLNSILSQKELKQMGEQVYVL